MPLFIISSDKRLVYDQLKPTTYLLAAMDFEMELERKVMLVFYTSLTCRVMMGVINP